MTNKIPVEALAEIGRQFDQERVIMLSVEYCPRCGLDGYGGRSKNSGRWWRVAFWVMAVLAALSWLFL